MMNSLLLLILIGFVIGTFGTLIGAGGGFILVPLLILNDKTMSPQIITAISIAVVAANAISGSFAYAKSGRVDFKAGILFALCTIPGSIGGVFLTKFIPIHTFNIVFGFLLIIVGVYLFIRSQKKESSKPMLNDSPNLKTHTITDKSGHVFSYRYNQNYGIIISVIVGFLSPLLGIGGGIIHVPALVQWLQFPVYIATATSHFILAIMSTVSVIVHILQGSYQDAHVLKIVLGLCLGVIPGAQLGAYISHRLQTSVIIKILAVCLAIVGLRILL
jgi:uncharacterized protein